MTAPSSAAAPQGRTIEGFEGARWLNPPDQWRLEGDDLWVTTNANTDLWRVTKGNFIQDDGHIFMHPVGDRFRAVLRVRARYEGQYDQAGIMVRRDERTWIKGGIELSDGEPQMGAILTIDKSDWSTGPWPEDPTDFWIRAQLDKEVLQLHASSDGERWRLVRMCPFPFGPDLLVGPMCCTPKRGGLEVRFSDFKVDGAKA